MGKCVGFQLHVFGHIHQIPVREDNTFFSQYIVNADAYERILQHTILSVGQLASESGHKL